MHLKPEDLSLQAVNDRSIELLKTLNSAIFPVVYQDKFYQTVLQTDCGYTHLAFYNGILAGAVCCRLECLHKDSDKELKLYIMTLGVLAAYRRLHIGSVLLDKILETAKSDESRNIIEVELHVQTSNDEAIAFYKKFGFEVMDKVEAYYKRIEPPDAYRLVKKVEKSRPGA
jgi:ribosomal protein S18 acetylase RimI-like enzyme